MSQNIKEDLRALTGLRGVAAWLVLFYHIRTGMAGYMPSDIIDFFAKGYLAVDLFFILSGFVMYLNYADRFQSLKLSYYKKFMARRIARIWPLHIFILLLCCSFVAILIATGRADHTGYPIIELPLHIILMQNWGFTDALSWNHPAWSISTELFAYLVFPFLASYIAFHRYSSLTLMSAIILLTGLLAFYFNILGYDKLGQDIAKTGLIRCLIEFSIGMIICALWNKWKTTPTIAIIASALIFLISLALLLLGQLQEVFAIPIGFAAFLLCNALLAQNPKNPLGNRVFYYLGEISYATYLVHFIFYIFFKIIFVEDPLFVSPYLVGLYCILVLILSSILYHTIEKPSQRWMNMKFSKAVK